MAEGLVAAQLGSSLISSGLQYKNAQDKAAAAQLQAQYQTKIIGINTEVAKRQAVDAIARGDTEAAAYKAKVNKFVGSQVAAEAANGVDVSSGTPLKLQEETQIQGNIDVVNIKNNAWREAYGYKVEALNNSLQGKLLNSAAANSSRNTLIAGGLQAATTAGSGLYTYLNK